jgi:hypothetical protein
VPFDAIQSFKVSFQNWVSSSSSSLSPTFACVRLHFLCYPLLLVSLLQLALFLLGSLHIICSCYFYCSYFLIFFFFISFFYFYVRLHFLPSFTFTCKFTTVSSFSLLCLYVFFFHVLFAVLTPCFSSSLSPSFACVRLHFICHLLVLVSLVQSVLFLFYFLCILCFSYFFCSYFLLLFFFISFFCL